MTLLVLLVLIFTGVALIAVVSKHFSGPADSAKAQQLQRWLLPLVAVMLVLSLLNHYI
tara:strand:- start:115876 stop:116049 length:174 start_codon:yes stop_codon:yes gene_type:complete